jgi:mannose-6-phosphate isomerase-like protein (cupin superfamily)
MECPKLKSLGPPPVWADDFRGFSLIFEAPGRNWAEEDGAPLLQCDLSDRNLKLYAALAEFASEHVDEFEDAGMAPLPPGSFHVTACDGIGTYCLDQLREPYRAEAAAFLAGLPGSCVRPPKWFGPRTVSLAEPWVLRLRFSKLHIWPESQALVAFLEPADGASARALDLIRVARRIWEMPLIERGKRPNSGEYQPHCSLSYFRDSAAACAAQSRLKDWDDHLRLKTRDLYVQFSSVSAMSYTDMSRFFLHRYPGQLVELGVLEAAIEASVGYLGYKGDQKLILSHHWPLNERVAGVRWLPLAANGKRHCSITVGVEVAAFSELAEQEKHAHRGKSTEIYTVLRGKMAIDAGGATYELDPGSTILIPPKVVHEVQRTGSFLTRVITAGCGREDRVAVTGAGHGESASESPIVLRAPTSPAGGQLTSGCVRLTVFDQTTAPSGRSVHLDTHIYWVTSGSMSIEMEGTLYSLCAGDMLMINPLVEYEIKRWGSFVAQALAVVPAGAGGHSVPVQEASQ